MSERIIYAIVDSGYLTSVWFSKSISGLEDAAAKIRAEVKVIDSLHELAVLPHPPVAVALISDKMDWTRYTIGELRQMEIKPILIGPSPTDYGDDISGTILNRQSMVDQMVQYFVSNGRCRLASVGNDPLDINDTARKNFFLDSARSIGLDATERDVFTTGAGLDACIEHFLSCIENYDGAICVNDYVAVQLLVAASNRGISVPSQLFVAGSGNMLIGNCTTPTLTTSTLNYYEMGCQSAYIWNYLVKNPSISAVYVSIQCELICRGSTAFLPFPTQATDQVKQSNPPDASLCTTDLHLRRLENCLLQCNALDFGIIRGVLDGLSGDQIAEKLFVSQGTVQYRLKKLYQKAGVNSRRTFEEFLAPYITNMDFLEKALLGK